MAGDAVRTESYSVRESVISSVTKPSWTLVARVRPAGSVSVRDSDSPSAVKPSPLRRGKTVVRLFFAGTAPVSSRPSAVVVYGDVARSRTSRRSGPVLVRARFVTAAFASVMNLVCVTFRPVASWVNSLRQ